MFSVKYDISSSSESDSDTKSGLQMLMSCFIPSSKYHKRKKIKKINLEHKKLLNKYKPVEGINTKIEKKKVPPPIPPPPSPLLLKKQVKSEYYNQLSKSDNNLHKEDTILRNCKSNTLNISKSTDKVNILHSPDLKSKTSSLPMRYQKRRAPPPPINISVCDKEECNKNVENIFKSNVLSLEDKVEPVKEINKSMFKNIEIVNQVDNPNFRKTEEVSVSPPILPVKKVPHDTKTLFGYSLEEQEQNLSYNKLSQNENLYCELKQNFIKSPEENINLCSKGKVVNLTDLSRKLFYQSSSYHRTKTKAKNDNSHAKEEKLSSNIMFDRFTNQNKEKEADLYKINDTMSISNLFTNHLHSDFNVKTKSGVTKSDDSFKERGNKDSSDSYIRKKIFSNNNNNNNKAVLSNTNTIFPFTITSENYVTFSSPEACFVTYTNANENLHTTKHSFVNDKNYLKHESLKESENNCQNKNNYQKSKVDAKENIFKEKNKLNKYNIKEKIKSDITKEPKLNLLIEKDKTDKDKQPLCNIFLDDSTINQNKEGKEFSLQHNYRKKCQIKSDKPLSILEEKQKFVINKKFNKTSELDTFENNYSMKKCPEKKLNSVHVQTESLFGELGVNVKNSNSGVCSSANFYRPTQEIRTPQTSTTLAVPLPELRANRTYRHDSLHSSNKAMSMSKKFQLITLFKQLETAIANGQHKKAAVLAKKLAIHKASCSLNELSVEENDDKNFIIVSLYIEDKFLHQGPFPLKIHSFMTLGMLKSKIEKEYSIPKEFQRWILNKRLVIDDDITLSDYDVTDAGCPLFLYLMYPSSESEASNVLNNNSSSNEENQHQNLFFEDVQSHLFNFENIPNIPEENEDVCSTCGILESCQSCRESKSNTKAENSHCRNLNVMAENHEINEKYENLKKEAEKNYQFLIQLDNQDLIPNADSFECSVCFSDVKANEGVVLRDCLHQFCKQCLANAIEFTENAIIKCLFRNDQYSCDSILQEREIKALVSPEVFERYLRRGLVTAESCTENSFHCKSPDCPGWCVYEDTINTFDCPVCFHVNCLSCQAIHEGLNCKQYQDELAYRSERDKEARETKEYLENMVQEGKAMFCPKCNVIVMKRWGCDWLKCSVCQTEICWITKQPRWGPEVSLIIHLVSLYIEDKFLHQGPFPLKIHSFMTLGMLKSKIEKEYSIPKEFQRWILNKRLVIDDDITLSDYDVTDAGCPLFLYLMYPSSESEASNVLNNNSSSNEENQHQNLFFEDVQSHLFNFENIPNIPEENEDVCSTCGILESCQSCRESKSNTKAENSHCRNLNVMAENHEINEKYENLKKEAEKNYQFLIQLDNQDLIPNADSFECSVCFSDVKANEGVVLRDCLHQFCKQCLANAIEFTENAIIKCLFRNDQYSCDSILQEREIKALVSPEVFERYLRRGLVTAESCTENSFHCKSPDCPGWCVYEDTINTFDCPVCFHVNCLSCQAIHEGLNCKQYQDELAYRSERDKEARETKEYLENMVQEGKAMFCPKCNVIVMKRWGCDWLKCSVCQTEICWITKQPRWGPEGHGDTSSGCRCGLDGKRCHPQCNYCH
ncbi:uncharacterized protein LOC111624680 [Centruroides sculpturatus]|uniref:uncharacterized protein LOC111624680 n=1 Tax=Centruroides sculpturatus TaxID=218467 RepID=UPI000C6F020E|nr:uncharacterized protein LOC111624680 [Centruroides sculpturatus]